MDLLCKSLFIFKAHLLTSFYLLTLSRSSFNPHRTAHIPFKSVCQTISKVIDQEISTYESAIKSNVPNSGPPAPVMLSLENHCDAKGQERVVEILKETLGDKLVTKHVAEEHASGDDKVRLDQLSGKLVVMVS